MRPPTLVVIEIHTGNTIPEAPGCCNCVPVGGSPSVQAVHSTSIAILIIHSIASTVLVGIREAWSTLYYIAVFAGIITSGVVLCGPSKSKFFYALCGFLYFVVGITDVLLVVVWFSNVGNHESLNNVIGVVPVTGSAFSLFGSAMAFKAAYMWDTADAVPAAVAVLAPEAQAV